MVNEAREMINQTEQSLLAALVLAIMFGMGATLRLENFKLALKNPKGILIGFASQFGIMPLAAYMIARFLDLEPIHAVALIMVGALPAGTTSNMFSYFARGDVALSISMTTVSTTAAILMTPLLLNFYAEPFTASLAEGAAAAGFQIPYKNIIISLVAVLVPVGLGMVLLRYSPGWAKAAEDWASFLGIFVVLFLLVTLFVRHGDLMLQTSWKIYAASISVGLLGFLFGYFVSRLTGLVPRIARTVSLETGIQNGPLAFAIIILSYAEPYKSQMLWLPIMYSFFIVITSSFLTLYYRKAGFRDWEIYENDLVCRELFGNDYTPELSGAAGQKVY